MESNGKLPHLFNPSKTANLVPKFVVEDLPAAELQLLCLSLQWKTCSWAEQTDDDDNEEEDEYMNFESITIAIEVYTLVVRS